MTFNQFQNPSIHHYPANYWFWQRIPTNQEIEAQLLEMKQAGYTTFFIQARLSFPLDQYLGEEYLESYRYAVMVASRLGLKVGIYDDYNWNSGHAGGRTVQGADHLREQQLFWVSGKLSNHGTVLNISNIRSLMGGGLDQASSHWTYEGGRPVWGEWKIIKAISYSPGCNLGNSADFHDITPFCTVMQTSENGCQIEIALPTPEHFDERVTVFVSARCLSSRMINYLDPAAPRRFIEAGYEPYKRYLQGFFGSTVFCVYMDHPHAGFYTWAEREGQITNSLMYHESLLDAFAQDHGYPMEQALLAFLFPESPDTPRLQCDFFQTYSQSGIRNFLGQVSQWAHQNGLLFAGHELFSFLNQWGFQGGFSEIDMRTNFGADYFGIGQYKDISTVDASNSDPQIDAKMGDAVALAYGSRGCMLEQYYWCVRPNLPGILGKWELTLDEMRSQAIRHTLLGTNQFIFHGFYLTDYVESVAGRQHFFDFAPGINFEPWFRFHSIFATELARLSAFIFTAQPIADVAVLYPLHTYWTEGTTGKMGEQSAFWNQWLTDQNIGFNIIDERQPVVDRASNGKIGFGTGEYSILVLPGVRTLRSRVTFNTIKDFVKTGGILILGGQLPDRTAENGIDESIRIGFQDLVDKHNNVYFFDNLPDPVLLKELATHIQKKTSAGMYLVAENDSEEPLWSWNGKVGDNSCLVLFNDSSKAVTATLPLPEAKTKISKWVPLTGETSDLTRPGDQKSRTVNVHLAPNELICLQVIHDVTITEPDSSPHIPLPVFFNRQDVGKNDRSQAFDPLILEKGWRFTIPGQKPVFPFDVSRGWEDQGFDHYSGVGIYENEFTLPHGFEKWEWELYLPAVCTCVEVYINNQSVGQLLWSPYRLVIKPEFLSAKSNRLRLDVYNTGGNLYFQNTPYQSYGRFPSGILMPPRIQLARPFHAVDQ